MLSPSTNHWVALTRVLLYLNGMVHHGLYLTKSTRFSHQLTIFSDVDWEGNPVIFCDDDWRGNPDDYSSTLGFIAYHGQNPMSWKSSN